MSGLITTGLLACSVLTKRTLFTPQRSIPATRCYGLFCNACSAFLNEDCLLWVTTEAFSGLILGNPSRLSGPRSLRGGSYPFAGYPNFCYDWGARAYNESGRYIGKPAHMRSKPAQRVLLRHVVVHYTDGHTTSLGLPFAMGSGLKSDKPTVQYALTGKREYMATTPKTSSRLLR